ncbi:unnamed protein product [Leptosia nina]|uniref:Zinc finger PHD-type domain-containing protein n=1 Tax=Leptosia nina TaxID=320188 RepID=A0AAV1JL90_9NEOP
MPICISCLTDLDLSTQIRCTKCSRGCHSMCANLKPDVTPDSWTCPPCLRRDQRGENTSPDKVHASSNRRNKESGLVDRCVSKEDLQKFITDGIGQALDCRLAHLENKLIESLKSSLFIEIREEIKSIITPFLKEAECLREEVNKLKNDIQVNNSYIEELRSQMNKQQQWNRINNLEIVGLPQTSNESTRTIVQKIADHAGVALQEDEIEYANRVQPKQSVSGRPKAIVVRLKSRDLKDRIISGLRKKRGILTTDIGMSGDSKKFFVNEHLTPDNKYLLKKAKERANSKGFKFVWVRNCCIFLRRNEESPVITINLERDLAKIC